MGLVIDWCRPYEPMGPDEECTMVDFVAKGQVHAYFTVYKYLVVDYDYGDEDLENPLDLNTLLLEMVAI